MRTAEGFCQWVAVCSRWRSCKTGETDRGRPGPILEGQLFVNFTKGSQWVIDVRSGNCSFTTFCFALTLTPPKTREEQLAHFRWI